MRGILVFALLLTASAVAAEPVRHVRSQQPAVREWIAEGYERSATFKALVDEIDGLPGIVYIDAMATNSRGLDGALLHAVAGSRELPLLRVLVRLNLSRAIGIVTIAHELQHVAEILRAGQTADSSAMTALFASIDKTHNTGSTGFETREAQLVGVRVRDELGRNPRR